MSRVSSNVIERCQADGPPKSWFRRHWHTVPGGLKISRVMVLVCDTPLTVYAKVAILPLVKVNVAVPTSVPTTLMGLNGTALNAGPVVRNRVPEYIPGPDLLAVTTSHIGAWS